METVVNRPPKPRSTPKVPDYLVKEMLDGKPIYYKNYKSILKNQNTKEGIMGASGLQIFIIRYFITLLTKKINDELYYVLSGEVGVHIDKGNNVAGDVMIYEKASLKPNMIDIHYLKIAPLINIEIDIDIDNTNFTDLEYVHKKTKNLLDFGTKKVIWIFTKTKQVLVAEPQKDWLVINWTKDIEILDHIYFNVPAYLTKEGIELN